MIIDLGVGYVLAKIVEVLEKYYGGIKSGEFPAYDAVVRKMHPLGVLISIVLSQNTSDKNAFTALMNLTRRLGYRLSPESFSRISDKELEELIKPSGMQRLKVRAIRELLKLVNENPDVLTESEPEELRKTLMSVKGIGPKTADVFLLMYRGYPTFPIDTHIRRVLYRLGLAGKNEGYESIREKVMRMLPESKYLSAHLLLIIHGRRTCTAKKPKCDECPVRNLCRRVSVADGSGT
ncbi:MAG: endonuclease III [Desulfurococcales archaeon]|nr:endonuclease III [Desulfurococcales archaeon]